MMLSLAPLTEGQPLNHLARLGIFAALALLATRPSLAEPSADVQTRCFQFNDQPAKLMQLRLVETQDDNEAAFVRYVGSKAWIPLVLVSSKRMPMADSGRSQDDTQWLEIVREQAGGHYALSMLGNDVVSFEYIDRKSGRRTSFALAPTPRGVDPCVAR